MTNRHHRRAEAAELRKRCTLHDKAAAVTTAMHYLARLAPSTATGGTIFHPDGTASFVSAEDARALYGAGPARGQA